MNLFCSLLCYTNWVVKKKEHHTQLIFLYILFISLIVWHEQTCWIHSIGGIRYWQRCFAKASISNRDRNRRTVREKGRKKKRLTVIKYLVWTHVAWWCSFTCRGLDYLLSQPNNTWYEWRTRDQQQRTRETTVVCAQPCKNQAWRDSTKVKEEQVWIIGRIGYLTYLLSIKEVRMSRRWLFVPSISFYISIR